MEFDISEPIYNYIATTGTIVPDAYDLLQEVGIEYQNVFGNDLPVPYNNPQAASTPQGVLIITETLARIAVVANNAMLANQINPNLAGGIFLDAIMALTGIQRTPSTYSTVTANLNGVEGTSVPQGTIVQDSIYNNQFQTIATYVIPVGGTYVGAQFEAVNSGPVPANAGMLTNIISQVLGLNSVTSSTQAQLGALTQSDIAARQYRIATLGIQSNSLAASIYANVTQVINADSAPANGEASLKLLENITSSTTVVDGVTMVANSIYVCVNGGNNGTGSTATVTLSGTATTVIPAGSEVSETINGTTFIFSLNPNVPFILPGTLNSSTTITMASTVGVFVGQAISGTGIPSSTTVTTVTPNTSIVISQAATISATENLTFTSTSWVIPTGGSINTPFTSLTSGIVPVPPASLTTIVTPVSGWASANNVSAGTEGTESDIALALTKSKSAGAAYNNGPGINIMATIQEPTSGQYLTVLYDNPDPIPIYVTVNIRVVTPVQDPITAVTNAIIAYALGQINGIPGLNVGQNVSAFEIAGAIATQLPGIYIQSLYTSTSATPTTSTEIAIAVYEIATIPSGNIIVNVLS